MDIYSALADPNRRQILELLAKNGSLSSTDISNKFNISSPAISQHLKVLRETELVKVEKIAQNRIYTINTQTISQLDSWVQKLTILWDSRFSRLDKVLEREKKRLEVKNNGR